MPAHGTHAAPGPAAARILPTQQLLLRVGSIQAACELLQSPVSVSPAAALTNENAGAVVIGAVAAVGPVQQGAGSQHSLRSRSLVSRCVQLDGEGGAVALWLHDDHVRTQIQRSSAVVVPRLVLEKGWVPHDTQVALGDVLAAGDSLVLHGAVVGAEGDSPLWLEVRWQSKHPFQRAPANTHLQTCFFKRTSLPQRGCICSISLTDTLQWGPACVGVVVPPLTPPPHPENDPSQAPALQDVLPLAAYLQGTGRAVSGNTWLCVRVRVCVCACVCVYVPYKACAPITGWVSGSCRRCASSAGPSCASGS